MSGTTSAYLEQPMHAGAVWLSDPMTLQPAVAFGNLVDPVSYTHLTLPTN